MRTTSMMGEVVGMAASLAHKYNETPRGVYQRHLRELKAMMKKGAAIEDGNLPNNQHFNESKSLLDTPRAFLPKETEAKGNLKE